MLSLPPPPRYLVGLLLIVVVVVVLTIDFVQSRKQYLVEVKNPRIAREAETTCHVDYRTNLATINSLEDQLILEHLISSVSNTSFIFGLNDENTERGVNRTGWQFTSGSDQSIEFFADNEPNIDKDCTALNRSAVNSRNTSIEYPWTSISCIDDRLSYVCDDAPNPRYIAILDQELSRADAQRFCRENYDSDLATVRTPQEQEYLNRLVGGFPVWIGLIKNNTSLTWDSNLPLTFTNFLNGQSNQNEEACVIAKPVWENVLCNNTHRFLCDKNFEAVMAGVPGQRVPTRSPTTASPTVPTVSPTNIGTSPNGEQEEEEEEKVNVTLIVLGGGTGFIAIVGAIGFYRIWNQEKNRLRFFDARERLGFARFTPPQVSSPNQSDTGYSADSSKKNPRPPPPINGGGAILLAPAV